VEHFEVMIAGTPTQLGQQCDSNGCVLGIADYLCQPTPSQCGATYIPNGLVFTFANAPGFSGNAMLFFGTAVQEIAHAWTLDHSTISNDPMTYKTYTTPLQLRDGAPCGSDCIYQCGTSIC